MDEIEPDYIATSSGSIVKMPGEYGELVKLSLLLLLHLLRRRLLLLLLLLLFYHHHYPSQALQSAVYFGYQFNPPFLPVSCHFVPISCSHLFGSSHPHRFIFYVISLFNLFRPFGLLLFVLAVFLYLSCNMSIPS